MKSMEAGVSKRTIPFVALLLAAAVLTQPALAQQAEDPLEGFNRKVFAFNERVDRWVLKPVAKGYDRVTPEPVQRSIGNFFENLGTPIVALNQFLQGKPKNGLSDFTRFLVNTTVGVGGLFDVAGATGIETHEEDYGQTFARWSGGQGTFIVIPFRGPATTTHAAGMIVGTFTSPLRLLSSNRDRMIVGAIETIDIRAELLDTERLISGERDRYLFIRDAYLQRREYQINDGVVEEDPFLDDF